MFHKLQFILELLHNRVCEAAPSYCRITILLGKASRALASARTGDSACEAPPGGLAYLGNGRFCRTIGIEYAEQEGITVCSLPDGRPGRQMLALLVAMAPSGPGDRGGDLRLMKHKVRCYKMSSHGHGLDDYVSRG
jgi:hypothetical protein